MLPDKPETFIISRTDSIGDVLLTLPMAGILKREYPGCKVYFLGRTYTQPIVEASVNIDGFINLDEHKKRKQLVRALRHVNADCIIHAFPKRNIAFEAQLAEIPMRIGTSHRWYNWLTCTYPVNFTRKKSDLHEAELNLKLLQPLGIKRTFTKDELPTYYGFQNILPLLADKEELLAKNKFNLVLHPLSKGSAAEWGLENYERLIELLPQNKFKLFVTGTADEGEKLKEFLAKYSGAVTDLTGQLNLKGLIAFINQADGIVAASTGPLHIAAALGKHAVGIYPPIKPIHPGRWAPLGKKAQVFVDEGFRPGNKILAVKPEDVAEYLTGLK